MENFVTVNNDSSPFLSFIHFPLSQFGSLFSSGNLLKINLIKEVGRKKVKKKCIAK